MTTGGLFTPSLRPSPSLSLQFRRAWYERRMLLLLLLVVVVVVVILSNSPLTFWLFRKVHHPLVIACEAHCPNFPVD